MNDFIPKLIGYHNWANHQLIDHLITLPHPLFLKEMANVFPTISMTLGHILAVDQIWLSRIQGQTPEHIPDVTFPSIEEVEQAFNTHSNAWTTFVQTLDPNKIITYQNTKGQLFRQPAFELIQHIANHGTYHRGNIVSMIRQQGYPGTSTDYMVYLR